MEDGLTRIQRQMLRVIAEGMQRWMNALLHDSFDPEIFLCFVTSLGIDPSRIPGMVGMESGLDPYHVLGLERTATDEEVKKRYRAFLMKLHPDTAGVRGTDFLLQTVIVAYQQIAKEKGWG